MLASWEIRWFGAGEPDSDAVDLFPEFEWKTVYEREDVYMRLPGVVDLGIKQREGRFEVKGRRLLIPDVQLAPGMVGEFEQWIKWSCEGSDLDPVFHVLAQADSLGIKVQKQRIQRKFHLGGSLEEVPVEEMLDRGAFFELARLKVLGERWWSLGFEAFPDDSDVPEQVAELARVILKDTALELPGKRSQSYPAWLGQLIKANDQG